MERHESFDESYSDAQAYDVGGAMSYTSTSPQFPGVVCREIQVYVKGRGSDSLWYEAANDPAEKRFSRPEAAMQHGRSIAAMPDETLIAEAKRRGLKLA